MDVDGIVERIDAVGGLSEEVRDDLKMVLCFGIGLLCCGIVGARTVDLCVRNFFSQWVGLLNGNFSYAFVGFL